DRIVVFHDPDGAAISSAKTGDAGAASARASAGGGMITVAHGTSVKHLITVMGVKPKDDVVVGERDENETVAKAAGPTKVLLPGPFPGAVRHTVSLGVGATEV